ncbi:MAG: ribosome-binding factor A, partial [Synergistota bacterium]|nr:ribosome-binding factor A [Synergistota bacterium]
LASVAGALRSRLGKLLSIRQVPALSFLVDTSEEHARSIDKLLDSLKMNEAPDSEPNHDSDAARHKADPEL